MKLQVSEIMTLDGVMEAPEQWVFQYMDPEIGEDVMAALQQTDAMLFGRKTFQEMAASWPERTGAMADIYNSVPKYVVSSTLSNVTWNDSHIITGSIVEEVAKLKAQPGKTLLLQGSADLVRLLAQHHLIDEYSLHIAPLVLGRGKRLFQEGDQAQLHLASTKAYKAGMLTLNYQAAGQ